MARNPLRPDLILGESSIEPGKEFPITPELALRYAGPDAFLGEISCALVGHFRGPEIGELRPPADAPPDLAEYYVRDPHLRIIGGEQHYRFSIAGLAPRSRRAVAFVTITMRLSRSADRSLPLWVDAWDGEWDIEKHGGRIPGRGPRPADRLQLIVDADPMFIEPAMREHGYATALGIATCALAAAEIASLDRQALAAGLADDLAIDRIAGDCEEYASFVEVVDRGFTAIVDAYRPAAQEGGIRRIALPD